MTSNLECIYISVFMHSKKTLFPMPKTFSNHDEKMDFGILEIMLQTSSLSNITLELENGEIYDYETNTWNTTLTPLHILNAQSASPCSLITAPKGGVLNVQRYNKLYLLSESKKTFQIRSKNRENKGSTFPCVKILDLCTFKTPSLNAVMIEQCDGVNSFSLQRTQETPSKNRIIFCKTQKEYYKDLTNYLRLQYAQELLYESKLLLNPVYKT